MNSAVDCPPIFHRALAVFHVNNRINWILFCAIFSLCGPTSAVLCSGAVLGEIRVQVGANGRLAGPVTLQIPKGWPTIRSLQIVDGPLVPVQSVGHRTLRTLLPALQPDAQVILLATSTPPPSKNPSDAPARIRPLTDERWELSAGVHRLIFQADPGTFPHPGLHPSYRRGGYVQSVFSPSGLLVSDDFPEDHIHHHGIWTAWTRTRFQGRTPDFWNVRQETGRVEFDALEQSWAGPVEVGLRSRHHSLDMSVHPPARALDETWHLRLYRMSNSSPYTLFDLDLEHQCATDDPLILPEYHYGGLGFRGHSNWNGAEKCFFLTSNGETNRVRGHATRANWCWMGGFVDNKLTGIAILCHPDNIRAPQAMRLHPTEPFFCFAPQLLGDMAIEPGQPLVSQYRFVVLDGYPRADFLDQLWLEYALAPQVEYQANSIDPIPPVAPAASESVESASAHSKTVHRPNVLFLFADDQTYETIRAGGHTDIDTPNLDRLTARGTTFSHVYNMGSFSPAVCVASRTMLVTGRTLWQARQLHNPEAIRKEADAGRLWPLQMREVGYQTFFTGKWHVPIDPAHVFDTVRHVRPGMPKDTAEGYSRPSPGIPDPWDPSDPKFGGFWEGGQHWSEVTADDAIDFLQIARDDPRPFFLYTAFNAPHDPRQSPAERLDTYPLERMKVPPSFLPEYPEKDLIGCPPSLRDEKLGPFPRTEHAVKVHRREYYALITHMDAQIGRILDALESSGQAANTYIFFTADHGLAVGHHGLFGKQNMYDHSLRVPFIVVGPDVPHGLTIATPALVQDVAPTVMELAGVQKPDWMAFRSLLPQILNPTVPTTAQPVYAAYLDLQRAVIADDYKLIHYPKADVTKLFHLPSDPLELRDLAQHPAYAGVQLALKSRLAQLKEVYHDPY